MQVMEICSLHIIQEEMCPLQWNLPVFCYRGPKVLLACRGMAPRAARARRTHMTPYGSPQLSVAPVGPFTAGCLSMLLLLFRHSVVSKSLQPRELWPARLLCPWDFPGESTEVGCHSLLRWVFPTQGSNLHLLLGKQILYH